MTGAGRLIVVTGAAGMIGSNVAAALAARGERVVACDRLGTDERWRYLATTALHDWIDPADLLRWLDTRAGDVAGIIHLGAISDTTERDGDRLVAHNVRPTLDLWERSAAAGWRFIYASSAATYGGGEHGFGDDDSPAALARLRPLNGYGWSKHVVDRRIARDVAEQLPVPAGWAGLKYFNVYGPNEDHKGEMRSLVRKIAPQVRAGETVRLFQSHREGVAHGDQRRDFIHVADAVAATLAAFDAPRIGGIFNVGTGSARSFADLARATFAAFGQEPRIEYVPMPEAIRDQYQYFTQADTARAAAAGVQPSCRSLEDGVAQYVAELLRREAEEGMPLD